MFLRRGQVELECLCRNKSVVLYLPLFVLLSQFFVPIATEFCGRPSPSADTRLQVSRLFPQYAPTANISVQCRDSSATLVGDPFIVCLSNGSWTPLPECIGGTPRPMTTPTEEDHGNVGGTVGMVLGIVIGVFGIILCSFFTALICRKKCPHGCSMSLTKCPPVCMAEEPGGGQHQVVWCPSKTPNPQAHHVEHPQAHSSTPVVSQPSGASPRPTTTAISRNGVPYSARVNHSNDYRFREDQPLRWHITHSSHRLSLDEQQLSHGAAGVHTQINITRRNDDIRSNNTRPEPVENEEESLPKDSVLADGPVPPSYGVVLRNADEFPSAEKDPPPPYLEPKGEHSAPPYPA